MWRRSKLKNKFGTLVIRDISRRLKEPTNKLKYVTVLFTKTTCIHSERIFAFSPEILHTERDELALLSKNLFPSLMILRCYGPQLDVSLRPSKSTGKTQHDVLRDVIMQFF